MVKGATIQKILQRKFVIVTNQAVETPSNRTKKPTPTRSKKVVFK